MNNEKLEVVLENLKNKGIKVSIHEEDLANTEKRHVLWYVDTVAEIEVNENEIIEVMASNVTKSFLYSEGRKIAHTNEHMNYTFEQVMGKYIKSDEELALYQKNFAKGLKKARKIDIPYQNHWFASRFIKENGKWKEEKLGPLKATYLQDAIKQACVFLHQ